MGGKLATLAPWAMRAASLFGAALVGRNIAGAAASLQCRATNYGMLNL